MTQSPPGKLKTSFTQSEADPLYSIQDFWRPRLAAVVRSNASLVAQPGWNAACTPGDSYVEARLKPRGEPELSAEVWLVAASGAVGKSTLAREICAATGAIYVDLAAAATVAGNYVVGGLVKNGLWPDWQADRTTILIDALDEARLRVTQNSFEDFLLDVAAAAKGRRLPLVLLGRVGIVDEASAFLRERAGLVCPVFDIELFDSDQAKRFVFGTLRRLSHGGIYPQLRGALQAHEGRYRDVIQELVAGLELATSKDGRQFSGYAPVLEAVATVIAGEPNPARINQAVQGLLRGQVLERVTSEILNREAKKLADQLQASVLGLNTSGLYDPKEQLDRLSARLLHTATPSFPAHLPVNAVQPYQQAIESLLPQHPFLDGTGEQPSGAVFAACIAAHALRSGESGVATVAERYVRGSTHAPNPFLLDFYLAALDKETRIPTEHIGFLYEAMQAKAEAGETTHLEVDASEGEEQANATISIERAQGDPLEYEFQVAANGTLKFGRRVSSVSVDACEMEIEFGDGGQLELVAPVAVHARTLLFLGQEMVVKPGAEQGHDGSVVLEADVALADVMGPPLVRSGATLQVSWPEARNYPWTRYAAESEDDPDPNLAEALRALRRLIISFRSHSKGQLARYKGKVEHFRMTKGAVGERLRERLLANKILKLEGTMYILDPDALGRVAGVSFHDIKLKRYGDQVKHYLRDLGE